MKPQKKSRKPVLPKGFVAIPPQDGEECFRNGIFCFNITKMLDDIAHGLCEFTKSQADVSVWTFDSTESRLNEEYVEAADLSRPVIIAEISPDRLGLNPMIDECDWRLRGYNLLDGNHRIEKAKRLGVKTLNAYILPMESHIRYMYEGFEKYTEYWNEKNRTR